MSIARVIDGEWIAADDNDPRFPPTVLPATPADLMAYAASARYAKQSGGITVNGSEIATDRDSLSMINGAYDLSLVKPDISISYKAVTGFVTLSADAIQAVAVAVGVHVQACFSAEGEVVAQIQAGQITTTAQIDQVFAAIS